MLIKKSIILFNMERINEGMEILQNLMTEHLNEPTILIPYCRMLDYKN
jgi:hypothetical protein